MTRWRNTARRRFGRVALALALALTCVSQAPAQEVAGSLLVLDQDKFFLQSDFGRAAAERERQATAALDQENKRIEAELVVEEQSLTDLRKTLPAAEFSAKAEAFDQKVERIRSEQDAKAAAITDGRDKDRKAFLQAAVPVLGNLLRQKKAVAILDKNLAIVSLSAIDVTDEAIAMVDSALKDPAPKDPALKDPALKQGAPAVPKP